MIIARPPHNNTVSAYIPPRLPECASVHCVLHNRACYMSDLNSVWPATVLGFAT